MWPGSLHLRKDIVKLKKVQRRVTKAVKGTVRLPNKEIVRDWDSSTCTG